MNRRNFIGGLLAATAGFMILPGAARQWKRQPSMLYTPFEADIIRCEFQFEFVDLPPRYDPQIFVPWKTYTILGCEDGPISVAIDHALQ